VLSSISKLQVLSLRIACDNEIVASTARHQVKIIPESQDAFERERRLEDKHEVAPPMELDP
jgi:hypothetical protein